MDILNEQLEEFLDNSQAKRRDSFSEETFTECMLCGEWEGHKDNCPVPAIEKWLNENANAKG